MKRTFLSFFICFLWISLPLRAQVLRETRAVWLTTLSGLDWPVARTAEAQRRELCLMLDSLAGAGINTVLFQTRIRGSVVYPSAIEPWDAVFGGHHPGYDPLAFAVAECHRRGMQLHAWIVCIPVAGKRNMDPGVPQTAQRIEGICREVVSLYDVDGIHLDYIRYPEQSASFSDRSSYRLYGRGRDLKAWRRDNITSIVRRVHDTVKSLKPWVCVSASPLGKRDDLARYSSRGWNAFDAVYQDVELWMRQGLLDAIFPMIYFDGDQFYPFALDWREQAHGCAVSPGVGVYRMATSGWSLDVMQRQLCFLRRHGLGQCFFRARFVLDDSHGFYSWLKWHNSQPAIPYAVRSSLPPPAAPRLLPSTQAGVLRWRDEPGMDCNVYAVQGTDTVPVAFRVKGGEWHFNPYVALRHRAHFLVRAVDRYGRESVAVAATGVNGNVKLKK